MEVMQAFISTSSPEDAEAYKTNFEAFKGSQSKHEVAQYYTQWAESGQYDDHLNPSRYSGPECAARALVEHFGENEREHARVLDVAAGTGRLAAELHRFGFRNMDALDPSEGMMRKAQERDIYTNLFNDFIGDGHRVPVPDNVYDALGVSGGFGEGHIPLSALDEMVRIVRPGGVIIIAMREEYMHYVEEYKGRLLPTMEEMEQTGVWKLLSKDILENYAFGKSGVIFHFAVL